MAEVTVLGAGVAGLWAARELLAQGITPRVIDRAGAPGPHGCSWWAGGMLAPQCEGAVTEPIIVRHGAEAAHAWGKVTELQRKGTLVLALERDRAELDRFAARTEGHRQVNAAEIAELEPHLAPRHRRGLFFETEAHLDPRRALADLVAALEADGVTVQCAEALPEALSGPVLDCRGFAAHDVLPELRAVRGEMVLLRAPEIELSRPVRLLHPRHPLYIVPRGGGLFMLGATQIESAARGPVTARSALELLSAAYALDPRFGEAEIVEFGSDLRPAFPDNVPRITPRGRVLHLNGLFRHGYLMAPTLARQAAAFIATSEKGDLFHED
ncbi:FAD-dependent oxidoreductase [Pontibaca salina]|uniref:FAD-dependent oxidoreductase n=1 Tax=Pontibaca salina TaxID=2795731 RepID=A0A934HQ04_9RHOB|nr:FAD-dependent oxidoreductase [Pontibaca salina]MBI6629597.1 FAD-dependent oxidoreductase [Pontibaca salina]